MPEPYFVILREEPMVHCLKYDSFCRTKASNGKGFCTHKENWHEVIVMEQQMHISLVVSCFMCFLIWFQNLRIPSLKKTLKIPKLVSGSGIDFHNKMTTVDQTPANMVLLMVTSWYRSTFCITGPLCGKSTDDGWFSAQNASNTRLDIFRVVRLNKLFSKQSGCQRFDTSSVYRQCHVTLLSASYFWISSDE